MNSTVDDWEKPRTHGQHLTELERKRLRDAYVAGKTTREIARELKCSTRIATKWFGYFRAEGVVVKGPTVNLRQRAHTSVADPAFPISRSKLMAGK